MNRAKLLSFVLLFAPTLASADDFAPPPWDRTSPFAITAEWEFFTPANPATADGPLTNVYTKGSGSVTTSATITGDHGLGWGGTSGGNWFFPDGGSIYFHVDNVIDRMPLKHLSLQITHTPGLGLFVDPLSNFNFGATGSAATTPVIISGSDALHTLIVWDMFPNPPWEDFRLHVTGTGEIRQVVLDTFSTVPEASTIVSCSLVVLTMGLVFWKCPRFWRLALG